MMAVGADSPPEPTTTGSPELGPLFDAAFLAKLERLVVVAKRLRQVSRVGDKKAPRRGSGLEFADHRAYAPGDDLRRLDWNLFGRLGRSMVRLYEQEEEQALFVLIDTSGSMALGNPRKADLALQVAAALAYIGLCHRDAVFLHPFAETLGDPLTSPPDRGPFAALLARLGALGFRGSADLPVTLGALRALPSRPGVCIVVSDLLEVGPVPPAVDRLLRRKLEVALLRITSPQDREGTGLGPGPTRLCDSETGTEVDLELTPALLRRYAERFSRQEAALSGHARRRRVPFVSVDAAVPFDEVVLRLLRAEGLLL